MENVPASVGILFGITVLATLAFLLRATHARLPMILILLVWIGGQSAVALSGFYADTVSMPPHFLFLVLPAVTCIILLFVLPAGRKWMDAIDLELLTWLHVVRVPVEIVLLLLFLYSAVPQLMTFEGRNFDIISGLTAPFVAWFGIRKGKLGKWALIAWNLACLGLLVNIVAHAVLSVPYPFQQLAFEQPNVGVLHFPYHLLPGFVVPAVLFAHLVALRHLIREK